MTDYVTSVRIPRSQAALNDTDLQAHLDQVFDAAKQDAYKALRQVPITGCECGCAENCR